MTNNLPLKFHPFFFFVFFRFNHPSSAPFFFHFNHPGEAQNFEGKSQKFVVEVTDRPWLRVCDD